jgi:hypothetical protein
MNEWMVWFLVPIAVTAFTLLSSGIKLFKEAQNSSPSSFFDKEFKFR